MPFSISAGVGFIALFGVAVLNGIVLSSAFPRLPVGITQIMVRNMLDGVVRVVPVPGYTPVGAFPTDVYAPAGYSVVQAYSNPAPAPALALRSQASPASEGRCAPTTMTSGCGASSSGRIVSRESVIRWIR